MYVCDSYAFLHQLLFLDTCALSVPCSVLLKKKLFDNVRGCDTSESDNWTNSVPSSLHSNRRDVGSLV